MEKLGDTTRIYSPIFVLKDNAIVLGVSGISSGEPTLCVIPYFVIPWSVVRWIKLVGVVTVADEHFLMSDPWLRVFEPF